VYNLKGCLNCAVRLVGNSARNKDKMLSMLSHAERYQSKDEILEKLKGKGLQRRASSS